MKHILVVDDNKANLVLAREVLIDQYQVATVVSAAQALQFLEKRETSLILLDINMPEMDGIEAFKRIRQIPKLANIPIIFLTAENNAETEAECLRLGAVDFISKPFVNEVMLSRISRTLELEELRNDLEKKLQEKTEQIEKVTLQAITVIANTVDERDVYTNGHSVRVAKLSEEIARRLGWAEEDVQNLHYVALLHDIGKIAIPDSILKKSTRLTDEEFEIIKKHSLIGGEILKDIKLIKSVTDGALNHHERYDGKGYRGLKGEEIPLVARILSIADAYDAMNSNRSYRNRLSSDRIKEELQKNSGTQFDPELVDVMLKILDEGFSFEDLMGNDEKTISDNDASGIVEESNVLLQKVLSEYTADIKNKSLTDPLTGLWNRAYVEEQTNIYMRNENACGALFMLDMDNFKSINDNYGHQAGDDVLKTFADVLREVSRKDDIVCRFGGDEYVVFYRGLSSRTEVVSKATRILEILVGKLHAEGYFGTSVSMGISMAPEDGMDFDTLYNNADKALYYVKENGKNSYRFFSNPDE